MHPPARDNASIPLATPDRLRDTPEDCFGGRSVLRTRTEAHRSGASDGELLDEVDLHRQGTGTNHDWGTQLHAQVMG